MIHLWTKISAKEVSKLYGDPVLVKRALEKLEATFEPTHQFLQRIFRVTHKENERLSKEVLDFSKKVGLNKENNYILFSYKSPLDISQKRIRKGKEIAQNKKPYGRLFNGK